MNEAVDEIMIQAQVFASAWSLVGGRFDAGHCSDAAKEAKLELEKMVRAAIAAAPAQERIDALELEVRQLTEQIAELRHAPTPQADSQPALPKITAEDRSFLHDNPNTDDIVKWVQDYARAAISADRAARKQGTKP